MRGTLKEFDGLFTRFRKFVEFSEQTQYKDTIGRFERIRPEFEQLKRAQIEDEAALSPTLNIFRLLGVERDEVKTHSALLSNLLNPRGAHGQGALFLTKFIELVQRESPARFYFTLEAVERSSWLIFKEKQTFHGTLDVVVACEAQGLLLVIENKIDAGEQWKQLPRYAEWIEKQKPLFTHRYLIFLTPGGRESKAPGIPQIRLSYKHHIVEWLAACSPNIQSQRTRSIVEQYLDVVRTIGEDANEP